MNPADGAETTATALAAAVRSGRRRAREECEARLERTREQEPLGAFWCLDADRALAEADAVDRAVAGGRDPGPLAGVPVAWKDCIDVQGLRSTAGAPFLGSDAAASDAVVVDRTRGAGAVSLGKLAMHQLAWGMSGQCPGRPPCRNPHDPERIPGGSSSGSAVAVAAGLVDIAPGTDSGGSVRAPAALCGVVGLNPTPGTVPLAGCLPLWPTLDNAGPIARSVADCALALAVLGDEPADPPALADLVGVGVGVLERHFCEDLDDGVAHAFDAALEALEHAGAALRPVDLGWQEDGEVLRAVYDAEPLPLVAAGVRADPAAYEPAIRADVERGLGVSALDYLVALTRLEERRRRARTALADVELVACPTIPIEPPALDGPDLTTTMNRNTKPFNGLGWPTISLPCGQDSGGMPVGIQLAAAPGSDRRLLALALAAEAAMAPTTTKDRV